MIGLVVALKEKSERKKDHHTTTPYRNNRERCRRRRRPPPNHPESEREIDGWEVPSLLKQIDGESKIKIEKENQKKKIRPITET